MQVKGANKPNQGWTPVNGKAELELSWICCHPQSLTIAHTAPRPTQKPCRLQLYPTCLRIFRVGFEKVWEQPSDQRLQYGFLDIPQMCCSRYGVLGGFFDERELLLFVSFCFIGLNGIFKKNKEKNAIVLDDYVFSGHRLQLLCPPASPPACLTHMRPSRIGGKVSPWSWLGQVTLSTAAGLVALSRARGRVQAASVWMGSCIPSGPREGSSPRPSPGPARLD